MFECKILFPWQHKSHVFENLWNFSLFSCWATHTINVHLNINKLSVMKDNLIYVFQINVNYVLNKNYQAHKLLKDDLYIPGG